MNINSTKETVKGLIISKIRSLHRLVLRFRAMKELLKMYPDKTQMLAILTFSVAISNYMVYNINICGRRCEHYDNK